MKFPDIINSFGVALILLAFALLMFGKLRQNDKLYSLINLVGAGLACYGSILIDAKPFIVLEAVWAAVALYGLIRK
ncbi:MAG TPA: DUF3188 domain-containing protein [Bacteroidia bacterium]|jgi:hypothetical protein|nr:DUF3188 domain-containing protein [Bacteroidia bacterium]